MTEKTKVDALDYYQWFEHGVTDKVALYLTFFFIEGEFKLGLHDEGLEEELALAQDARAAKELVDKVESDYGVTISHDVLQLIEDFVSIADRVRGVDLEMGETDCDLCGLNIDHVSAFVIPEGKRHEGVISLHSRSGCNKENIFTGSPNNAEDVATVRDFMKFETADLEFDTLEQEQIKTFLKVIET